MFGRQNIRVRLQRAHDVSGAFYVGPHFINFSCIAIAVDGNRQRQRSELVRSGCGRSRSGGRGGYFGYFAGNRDVRHFQKRKETLGFGIPEWLEEKEITKILI